MGPEKRLPLALFTCFVVLFGLQLFIAPAQVSEEDRAALEQQLASEESPAPAATASDATDEDVAEQTAVDSWDDWLTFGTPGEQGYMQVHFDSYGGSVSEIRLGNYFTRVGFDEAERADRENWVRLVRPGVERGRIFTTLMVLPGVETAKRMAADPSKVHWRHEVLEEGEGVRFVHEDPRGVVLTKTIRPVPGTYDLDVELGVSSTEAELQDAALKFSLVAAVGMEAATSDSAYSEPQAVAAYVGGDPKTSGLDLDGSPARETLKSAGDGPIGYFGCQNKYFAMLMRPADEVSGRALRESSKLAVEDYEWVKDPSNEPVWEKRFRDMLVEGTIAYKVPAGGETSSRRFELYAGPKDASFFVGDDAVYQTLLREDLGFFDGIASVILGFLRFLHGLVGNWGWAIILLTLTVRMLLFPLQRKMQTSMARHATKMRRVQPKLDAIKEQYAKDPQKLRQEQARIFKEEGAMPPIGGCLPIFLQIPIFFGLFSALRVAFDLRHQPFVGWIQDLSQPDRLITFADSYPFFGDAFNLLPILMVILWIGQQKVMPKPATTNEQQAQMQKIMMWMPIMFGFFLYNYASGLSLYMITTSAFGIIESTVIRRVWPIDETEQTKKKKKKSRFMARVEELQKQAVAMQEQKARAQQGKGGGKKRR
ncbi:MAG: YidC/Oxa1 family insertase periplasmic-domain containing protein [Planctomycetota bacterium]|nr:YidC/Oxa1 family insertase periplasmic-domain containing protein [Planctomycetota bacterium]